MTRFANIGASAIFIFMGILLIISRVSLPGDHPVLNIVLSIIIVFSIHLIVDGYRASIVSLFAIGGFFAILLAWAFATSPFFSPGDDEYGYHILAVWDLAKGWDPFSTPHDNIWLDSYPSGYYVLQSYLVSITGLLLSGQSLVVGMMAAVGLLAYGFFAERISPHLSHYKQLAALIFALILVANPIVLTQIMTHYVDTPLYLFGCALVFFLMSDAISYNRLARWSAVSCIVLLINTKTSALYYTPLIVFGGFVMEFVLQKAEPRFFHRLFKYIRSKGIIFGTAITVSVVVIGYKPYVTNTLDHGKLLYPSTKEIMSYNIPANIVSLPPPVKFFYGLFSETGETLWPSQFDSPIFLKVPGTFRLSEFKVLRFDTRRGGFGPFFGLAFLASIFAYSGAKLASGNKKLYSWHGDGDGVAAFAIILLGTSIFFPEPWWARYVPFVWLSSILFIASSLCLNGKGKALIFLRILQGIALVSFLLCIVAATLGGIRQNIRIYKSTIAVETLKDLPVIEFYLERDDRITIDYQSTSISNADAVWTKLFKNRGVNTKVMKNGDEMEPRYCDYIGYLEAHVVWCAPKDQAN
ncbi:MAG: hypothetical protein K9G33_10895 [Sneathiella sp.]|nr:hypothetical protein [Sneathiella sp.]